MSRLQKKYKEEIRKSLNEKHANLNISQIPKLEKIVINMGVAEVTKDKTLMQDHTNELTMLSGQKPKVCKAKKSIANFKLREEQPIGLMVTLRNKRMYDFLDRFINITAPRIRDFRGFKAKGDGRGSYSLGLDDQQIFAEVNLDKVKRQQGMNITFVTSAEDDAMCIELLTMFGFPFKTKVQK